MCYFSPVCENKHEFLPHGVHGCHKCLSKWQKVEACSKPGSVCDGGFVEACVDCTGITDDLTLSVLRIRNSSGFSEARDIGWMPLCFQENNS